MRIKNNQTRKFLKFLDQDIIDVLVDIGLMVQNDIKTNMRGKSPPPSAPGEYPHVVTAALKRSIHFIVNETKHFVKIGTSEFYGKCLGLGTKKMRPRPFIRPTVEKDRQKIKLMFGKRRHVIGKSIGTK